MKRQRIAALCAALMLAAAVPLMPRATTSVTVYAQAAETMEEGGFSYGVDDAGNGIIKKYTGTETEVTIPSVIGGAPVTQIWCDAFRGCTHLTAVTIPDGAAIGANAFYGCTALTDVTIPAGVTEIGAGAFTGTPWLAAQQEKDPLVIVNGILIDGTACEGDVTVPDEVTAIGELAFFGCEEMTSLKLPEGITAIPYGMCSGCTSLTAVTIPEGVQTIDHFAFYHCKSLTDVTLPSTLTVLYDQVFANCTALTDVTVPQGVEWIGLYAFKDCQSLASVEIPRSVIGIGSGAFTRCDALTLSVYEDSKAQTYAEENGIPYVLIGAPTLLGDIDGDGTVSIIDAIMLNKSILGGVVLSESARANADMDRSGTIDTTDALLLLKAVVKL